MLILPPLLVWGVDAGPAMLCVRMTRSACSGGSDTPPRCLGAWVLGTLTWLWRHKGRKTCTATSPSAPRRVDQGTAPSAPRVCLIHEFPTASRIHPGLILRTGGHWARQATNRHRRWREVCEPVSEQDGEASLCVEDSLGACVWAGCRGVSVCESECNCPSCCLSPALSIPFS